MKTGSILKRLIKKKSGIVKNVNGTYFEKYCLLLYITSPFLAADTKESHQNIWQVREIARIIGEMGFNADAADFNNKNIKLSRNYDLIIDISPDDHPVYAEYMNPDCKKIAYLTGSNPEFSNEEEKKRIAQCNSMRGSALLPKRQVRAVSRNIKSYDAFFFIGNMYNLKTYSSYILPKVYWIPNTGYDFGSRVKQTAGDKRKFLFFSSAGQVHKGLNLLLDIFASDSSLELYVCSPFAEEKDFEKEYYQELYETKNIHAAGFTDIWGEEFRRIASECVFSIHPSCSEGMSGAVLTVMSMGIIPLCTRECGFDENEVIILNDAGEDTIRNKIAECLQYDDGWIRKRQEYEVFLTKTRYSRQAFSDAVKKAVTDVMRSKKDE